MVYPTTSKTYNCGQSRSVVCKELAPTPQCEIQCKKMNSDISMASRIYDETRGFYPLFQKAFEAW